MSNAPTDRRYAKSHEWIKDEGDGSLTIGITDHAQELLGDLVFVDLPEVGQSLDAGGDCAVVESVKAASDVYSPVSGEVIAINDALDGAPETINEDAFGDGWMFKVKASDMSELDGLLDAEGYDALVAEEE
ncbi:MAG: glycine cleavage system protein GcvH [Candidatus Thiodiazotropha lotti]|uniref:Glycine cleavage system H protein n=1 Tax=Candidatus Thiodiazotropha endoloripes TaxID=1818881 RepID=A0A1E2ULK7_9GAMM|nr:glycine cleavage system protein GcvH [Candidatus Thiodiazotropha endoloripes]MCG7900132.1 glycine cleavage system protein GcvH [Candidatus Thiodiazotropha weberae]MCG7991882.1 glycine cleavage system protein GcvH [Candidatus Thiodiazotropha lotti]MCG7901920.1 glycine cleavage system protein GcvH [Candidatus Thiodiazotropha weberae]MCG7912988.1 glycine cleavage system protein GcvH [Candidatus Thiodiazotropha weberae]MCG7998386.1 glycine cleavage system protein GcvH [Candidatus Thiodiazotroph